MEKMSPRDRIIDTAGRLFFMQGYNNTGINQLIKEARVAKASFYEYFPSKEHLLIDYIKTTAAITNTMLEAAIAKANTPKDKIMVIFDQLIRRSRQTQFNGCNFLNILAEVPHGNNDVRGLVRSQKDYIRSLFAGILGPGRKDRLADELYLLFDAALAASKVFEDPWPIELSKKLAGRLI